MITAEQTVTISLETQCDYPSCSLFAQRLYRQLSKGYETCSVLELPDTVEWSEEHRTARKRVMRAIKSGYVFQPIVREIWIDDVHAINTSMPERQGRAMSKSYTEKPTFTSLPEYPCVRHAIRTYGVIEHDSNTLVAYLWLYRAGELALVSSILGHAEHLDNGVMYLLMAGVITHERPYGRGQLVYNRHDSGTDGLRFYKERCGFRATEVQWAS